MVGCRNPKRSFGRFFRVRGFAFFLLPKEFNRHFLIYPVQLYLQSPVLNLVLLLFYNSNKIFCVSALSKFQIRWRISLFQWWEKPFSRWSGTNHLETCISTWWRWMAGWTDPSLRVPSSEIWLLDAPTPSGSCQGSRMRMRWRGAKNPQSLHSQVGLHHTHPKGVQVFLTSIFWFLYMFSTPEPAQVTSLNVSENSYDSMLLTWTRPVGEASGFRIKAKNDNQE